VSFKKLIILIIICLTFITGLNTVFAGEIYYPIGSSPLADEPPFSGETFYPEGDPVVVRDGVEFWYYNDGSGKLNLNLTLLSGQYMVTSPPVVSPDFNHIVYTEVYRYPDANQVVSKCYYIPVVLPKTHDDGTSISMREYLESYKVRHDQQVRYEVLTVGTSGFYRNVFRSLTIVDWDYTATRVLIKEHVGKMSKGLFGTIIWVYDVEYDKVFRVDTVRKAIVDYWMTEKDLDLTNYIWDIEILGWEEYSNNRFIVNAYLYPSKGVKKFLGAWKADIRGNTTTLLSLDQEEWSVARNGLIPQKY